MEINTVVTKYIPDKPKVLANEQIEVYVPTANYNYPGMASFDTNGFIVDAKGKVKLRRNSVRNVSTFDIDPTTGECTIYYDDGTVATIAFPVTTNNLYRRQGLMTTIDVKPTSFVEHVFEDGTKVWLAAFSNAITGFDDDKFIVSLEERGNYTYRDGLKYEEGSLVYEETATKKNGYFTIMDTVFKSNNGSVLISIENEADKDAFDGRLLLLGGSVFTDTQIVSITYNKSKQEIHILKSDGSTEIIGTVTSNDIDEVIAKKLSTVYYFKGSTTFSELPTQEILDKGDLIGATWYVTDAFVTDARFREGYGLSVPAGTNIAVLKTDEGDYKYDVLGSLIDLTDYVKFTDRDKFVKEGITDNKEEWTDADQAKACETIGAVKIPNITTYGNYVLSYFVNENGKVGKIGEPMRVQSSAGANTIPLRGPGGVVSVGIPSDDVHATPRGYVNNLPDHLTLTENTTDESGATVQGTREKWLEWLGATPIPNAGEENGAFCVLMPNGKVRKVKLAYSNAPSINGVPVYNSNKTIMVNNAVDDTDAPNFGQVKKYADDAIANAVGSTSGISLEDWEFTLEDGTTVTKKVCVSKTGNIGGIGGGSGTKLYQHKMRVSYFAICFEPNGDQVEIEREQNIVINSILQDLRNEDKTTLDYARIVQEGEAYRLNGLIFLGRLNGMSTTQLVVSGIFDDEYREDGNYEPMPYFIAIESAIIGHALVLITDILSYEVTEL